MSTWSISTSMSCEIFSIEEDVIEMWNSIVFNYSKFYGENYYQQNYLFYRTSQDSDFSKEEILTCLEYAITLLETKNFYQILSDEDADLFKKTFDQMKKVILKDESTLFQTHFSDLHYQH